MNEDWGFARACDLARTADESFAMAQLAEIEAAWQVVDLDHGDFGFIIVMADGRRLYWRYTAEDTGAGRPEDLEVSELGCGGNSGARRRSPMVPAGAAQRPARGAAAVDVAASRHPLCRTSFRCVSAEVESPPGSQRCEA